MKKREMRRQQVGTVVSNKMDQTAIVRVERLIKHRMYKKYIRRHVKFSAHDPGNACQIGDKVLLTESRPLSKFKRWRVSSILEKAI